MKIHAILTLFVLSCSTAPMMAENKAVKIILLAGQSNMSGVGPAADLKPPFSEPFDQVKIWGAKARSWNALWPGVAAGTKHIGPEISFGHAVAKLMPDADVRLVKWAPSGTSLYEDWSPETGGPQWKRFIETADAALADLDKKGVKYEVAGMLWLQGESDAQKGRGDQYEENLRNFIAAVREHFELPSLPIVIARVRDFYGRENGHARLVREAQVKVATTTPGVGWFDTDDCALVNPGHYNTEGQMVIGRRFAEELSKVISKPDR